MAKLDTVRDAPYRNRDAFAKVTVQSSLIGGYHQVVHRKRRPFPGDVFVNLIDSNQLLPLVSIRIP